jgi:hypothetical protein
MYPQATVCGPGYYVVLKKKDGSVPLGGRWYQVLTNGIL